MAMANTTMFAQVALLALDNLRANKVRSFLTMLGIVIGILSVIIIAAIVSGLNGSFEQQVANIGTNVVTITRLPQFVNRRLTAEERTRKDLSREDADAVRQFSKHTSYVCGILFIDPFQFPNVNLRYMNKNSNGTRILGVEPTYLDIYNSTMRTGHFITFSDDEHRTKVMVIGATVAENMFPFEDPIGKSIQVEDDTFEIIGVMEKRGSFLGFDRDNFAWVPLGTLQKLHSESHSTFQISMSAKTGADMPMAIDEATEALRIHRNVGYNKPNSFEISTQNQFLDFYKNLTSGLYLTMIIISSIALMVGGIGVMNIMLVSVTERTREIGVRKAIGARMVDILQQFILEAVVLCAVAGACAILIGVGLTTLIDKYSPLPAHVPFWLMMMALGVSASIGLFFGIYPAARAAKLDPIEALRYE